MERIVLAVDGSESSNRAVQVAKAMAQPGGEVRVVEVDSPPIGTKVHAPHVKPEAAEKAAQELIAAGIKAQAEVVTDNMHNPAKAILEEVASYKATHVVMGTRGLSDLEGLLLGSVTHKVIQKSSVPVTVVP